MHDVKKKNHTWVKTICLKFKRDQQLSVLLKRQVLDSPLQANF